MSDEQTIVVPVSAAVATVDAEAVQAASSAEIAAEAAASAIATSNAASAMAEVKAAEQVREVVDTVEGLEQTVENEKENFKWLVAQVEICFAQLEALTAENLEITQELEALRLIVVPIQQSTATTESQEQTSPPVETAEIPPVQVDIPEKSAVLSPVVNEPQKRKHRPL